jgi:hypothetical protein
VSHNHTDFTLFEKTNKLIHLVGVCIPNAGNLPIPYTEEMRKYAEMSIEVKQQWQLEAVYTLPLNVHDAEIILHTLHDVLKRLYLPDLQYVTTQRSVILNTCNIVRTFLGDSIFQQVVTRTYFTFVTKRMKSYDSAVLNTS